MAEASGLLLKGTGGMGGHFLKAASLGSIPAEPGLGEVSLETPASPSVLQQQLLQ